MQGRIVPAQPQGPAAGRGGLYPPGPEQEESHHCSAADTETGGGGVPGGAAGEWPAGQGGADRLA